MKKPVVAMNYGGVSEIIKDGKNGFLADNENIFIKKVEELILDNNLRSGMGEEGRKCVVENFSLLSMQDKLLQILKK